MSALKLNKESTYHHDSITTVLDHGYVRLLDVMGNDLTIVNSARTSYDKESQELDNKDIGLLNYLMKHKHYSPLRHAVMAFEIYAPLMVKNQWIKHLVGSSHVDSQFGWNESSRRYVTEELEYYTPMLFSEAPESSKQGAGGIVDQATNEWMQDKIEHIQFLGSMHYEQALEKGIAPEQARLLLPAYGLYVRWRWVASLDATLNFINLRLGEGAQNEIVEYARVIADYTYANFPETMLAYSEHAN